MKRESLHKTFLFISILCVIFVIIFIIREYAAIPLFFREESLFSLQYLSSNVRRMQMDDKKGVTLYNPELSCPGINIYTYIEHPEAYLMGMSGELLHNWSVTEYAYYVKMCDNGDLLALIFGKSLMRLDWDSNIKWIREIECHHDIDIADNGDIYTLTRKEEPTSLLAKRPFIIDYITILTRDGKIKKDISLVKITMNDLALIRGSDDLWEKYILFSFFKDTLGGLNSDSRRAVNKYVFLNNLIRKYVKLILGNLEFMEEGEPIDALHTNALDVINQDIFREGKRIFKQGDVLFCPSLIGIVGIADINKEKLLWHWKSGKPQLIHHSTLLENGNILIFDNGGQLRGYSSIIELNPLTKQIVWEYKARPLKSFFSLTMGAAQRLPNGNTLITESEKAHVFEITPDGKKVWEFYGTCTDEDGKRKPIYRMIRIVDKGKLALLRKKLGVKELD